MNIYSDKQGAFCGNQEATSVVNHTFGPCHVGQAVNGWGYLFKMQQAVILHVSSGDKTNLPLLSWRHLKIVIAPELTGFPSGDPRLTTKNRNRGWALWSQLHR